MTSSREHSVGPVSWTMLLLCCLSLLTFLAVSESFRAFCREIARLGSSLLAG